MRSFLIASAAGARRPRRSSRSRATWRARIKGMATLTDQQAKDLEAGLWYFNVHTAKFPDGEIRGQLAAAP